MLTWFSWKRLTVKNKAKQRGAGVKRTHFKKVKRRKEIRKLLISRDILNISACLLVGKRYFIPFLFQKTIMLIYMHGYIYIIMINVVKSRVFITYTLSWNLTCRRKSEGRMLWLFRRSIVRNSLLFLEFHESKVPVDPGFLRNFREKDTILSFKIKSCKHV